MNTLTRVILQRKLAVSSMRSGSAKRLDSAAIRIEDALLDIFLTCLARHAKNLVDKTAVDNEHRSFRRAKSNYLQSQNVIDPQRLQ